MKVSLTPFRCSRVHAQVAATRSLSAPKEHCLGSDAVRCTAYRLSRIIEIATTFQKLTQLCQYREQLQMGLMTTFDEGLLNCSPSSRLSSGKKKTHGPTKEYARLSRQFECSCKGLQARTSGQQCLQKSEARTTQARQGVFLKAVIRVLGP